MVDLFELNGFNKFTLKLHPGAVCKTRRERETERERERKEKLPTNCLCLVIEPEEKFIFAKVNKK